MTMLSGIYKLYLLVITRLDVPGVQKILYKKALQLQGL